jgi:hypothetical protein
MTLHYLHTREFVIQRWYVLSSRNQGGAPTATQPGGPLSGYWADSPLLREPLSLLLFKHSTACHRTADHVRGTVTEDGTEPAVLPSLLVMSLPTLTSS